MDFSRKKIHVAEKKIEELIQSNVKQMYVIQKSTALLLTEVAQASELQRRRRDAARSVINLNPTYRSTT